VFQRYIDEASNLCKYTRNEYRDHSGWESKYTHANKNDHDIRYEQLPDYHAHQEAPPYLSGFGNLVQSGIGLILNRLVDSPPGGL